jgi:farnesyl-diphosphate farnesyltransferase
MYPGAKGDAVNPKTGDVGVPAASAPAPELLDDLLVKTSRTFALSIPVLPEPTRREVTVAYLLFRIADTLEDSTLWPQQRKLDELGSFDALLAEPSLGRAAELAGSWVAEPPLDHEGYVELLSETPRVLQAWLELDDRARALVARHTRRTIEGMAGFVSREERGLLRLTDLDDLRAYCYAVAGIVGEMLTELFLLGRSVLTPLAPLLRRNAATFGEALQLVNILKDSTDDAEQGRCYLPPQLPRAEVTDLARRDLAVAGRYSQRLFLARAPRGVVEFTLLPVLLARATLDRLDQQGPGAKITRDEVRALVARMHDALDRGDLAELDLSSPGKH